MKYWVTGIVNVILRISVNNLQQSHLKIFLSNDCSYIWRNAKKIYLGIRHQHHFLKYGLDTAKTKQTKNCIF